MGVPLWTSLQRIIPWMPDRSSSCTHGESGATRDPEEVWFERFQITFAVIAIVATFFALVDVTDSIRQRLISVLIVSVIIGAYRRLILYRKVRNTPGAVLYFAIALPSFFALILLHPAYQLLAFAAYWQVFAFLSTRRAMVGAAILSLMMISAGSGNGVTFPLLSGADWIIFGSSMVTGGMMAAFIHSLFVQSEKRQLLIDELEVTRSQLAVQERQAGMLQERHRIAGDFHDTVAQDLASVVMQLEAAEARLSPGNDSVLTHIRLARDTARSGLIETRRIVQALVPDVLSAHSIVHALGITSSRWSESTRTPCSFEVVGDPPSLDRQAEVVLLRSLQEALTNVRKHANASSVVVTLTNLGDEIVLDVFDNGDGLPTTSTANEKATVDEPSGNSGLGLVTMRERVESINGVVSIESSPGSGVTVSISLPGSPDLESGAPQPATDAVGTPAEAVARA